MEFQFISLLFQINEMQSGKTKKAVWDINTANVFFLPNPHPRSSVCHRALCSMISACSLKSPISPKKVCTFANDLVIGAAVSPSQAVLGAVAGVLLVSYLSASVLRTLPATSWNDHVKAPSVMCTNPKRPQLLKTISNKKSSNPTWFQLFTKSKLAWGLIVR